MAVNLEAICKKASSCLFKLEYDFESSTEHENSNVLMCSWDWTTRSLRARVKKVLGLFGGRRTSERRVCEERGERKKRVFQVVPSPQFSPHGFPLALIVSLHRTSVVKLYQAGFCSILNFHSFDFLHCTPCRKANFDISLLYEIYGSIYTRSRDRRTVEREEIGRNED